MKQHYTMRILSYFLVNLLLFAFSCNPQENENKVAGGKEMTAPTALTEKNACLLSEISYCTDLSSAVATYMPGWKIIWEATELEGNHAFVASNGNEYAMAIRGSLINFTWAAFQNWIYQDLHVVKQNKWEYTNDSSRAKLAQGAYDGWQNLCRMVDKNTGRQLLPFLEKELKEDAKLLITGHSLGGNLATVYASYLWQEFNKIKRPVSNINVITFAAPAAGNEAFANDFNKKFPASIRVENVNDIVPKFPSASGIVSLGNLFNDSLSSAKIQVGYKSLTVSLSTVFSLMKTTMSVLEFTNGISTYVQTNGKGRTITIPLSGKNNGNDIVNWFAEAGYQHGIERYAVQEGVSVVKCTQ